MTVDFKGKFFIFNPKSYLFGEHLLEMARVADQLALDYPDIAVVLTCPYADLYRVASQTQHLIVCAQHLDGIEPGRGMGAVLPDSLYAAGARATFLNHAEHPLSSAQLVASVKRAHDLGMATIVCADSLAEARALSLLEPTIMLCEPTELIGTGQTSDDDYMAMTNQAVKALSPRTLIMQGAGIMTPEDVYRAIRSGADGTGCTSGIVKAPDPVQMLRDMVAAVDRAMKEG